MILGLISDSHGLLRDSALRAMAGADLIIHAGDMGKREILEALEKIAPVVAVRGNVDIDDWASELPATAEATASGAKIFVLHDLNALKFPLAGVSIVVSGHSHKPAQHLRKGVLYINPGSCGPKRFQLPITAARLDLARKPWNVEFVDVSGA